MTTKIPDAKIAKPGRALFGLALDAQQIDGEMAIALGMISSDDEEERAEGENLLQLILEAASETQEAIVTKSDQLLEMAEWLQARSAHLKATAKLRREEAEREEAAAEALIARVAGVLSTLNPGQTSFALTEHTLASRKTSSVEVVDPGNLPDAYAGLEVKVKIAAPGSPTNHQFMIDLITQTLDRQGLAAEVTWVKSPDKRMLAQVLKSEDRAVSAEGCARIKEGRSWKIK